MRLAQLLLALFAGYAAHSGALSFGTLIVVCWFGSFTGDVVRFWIGRRFGTRWAGPFPRLERAVQTAAQLANRHYIWMIPVSIAIRTVFEVWSFVCRDRLPPRDRSVKRRAGRRRLAVVVTMGPRTRPRGATRSIP